MKPGLFWMFSSLTKAYSKITKDKKEKKLMGYSYIIKKYVFIMLHLSLSKSDSKGNYMQNLWATTSVK